MKLGHLKGSGPGSSTMYPPDFTSQRCFHGSMTGGRVLGRLVCQLSSFSLLSSFRSRAILWCRSMTTSALLTLPWIGTWSSCAWSLWDILVRSVYTWKFETSLELGVFALESLTLPGFGPGTFAQKPTLLTILFHSNPFHLCFVRVCCIQGLHTSYYFIVLFWKQSVHDGTVQLPSLTPGPHTCGCVNSWFHPSVFETIAFTWFPVNHYIIGCLAAVPLIMTTVHCRLLLDKYL